ncbi:45846_t:CDS:1, partial [Gigaspora margarita]
MTMILKPVSIYWKQERKEVKAEYECIAVQANHQFALIHKTKKNKRNNQNEQNDVINLPLLLTPVRIQQTNSDLVMEFELANYANYF